MDPSDHDNKSKLASIDSGGLKSRGTAKERGDSIKGDNSTFPQKYDIPNNCKLQLLKASRIQKLEENFLLMVHPYPQIEGELLLFQVKVDEQEGDFMTYRDFSLVKRMQNPPVSNKAISAMVKKKMLEEDVE